jgi:hypothetical protein
MDRTSNEAISAEHAGFGWSNIIAAKRIAHADILNIFILCPPYVGMIRYADANRGDTPLQSI